MLTARTFRPVVALAALLCAGWLVFSHQPASALEVPKLTGYVNDEAGMISPSTQQALTQMLKSFEQSDSTQIAILTIPTLDGESLEAFSMKVAETWKIGQEGKDNGAILLVSKADRKIRIEVGYGLEGRLTDIQAGSIIDNVITPEFKAGNFDQGFLSGAEAMIQAVRGEYTAPPPRQGQGGSGRGLGLFPVIVMLIIFFSIFGRVFSGRRSRGSGMGWLLLGMFLGGGPRGGGGFGGGGFGGGGFSGGGGGFGGGGASGGW